MNKFSATIYKYNRKLKRHIQKAAALLGYEFIKADGKIVIKKRQYIGGDYLTDIRFILKKCTGRNDLKCCIDGGAHRGETSLALVDAFPQAIIYSFEPEPENFKVLCQNTESYAGIRPLNLALGEANQFVTFYKNYDSQTGSLLAGADSCTKYAEKAEQMQLLENIDVEMTTLDDWAETHNISSIDLIKLDLQGYELNALIGAKNLLKNKRVTFLLIEVIFVPAYKNQSQLAELYEFVTQMGYRLVSLYPSEFNARSFHYRCGGDMLLVLEDIR
ncbi:MAG: FkbM family methyltransferase [Deltaproteobacteria bacterium]|nr:FkbM family methyltransferase [Candidatus Poribacteria bacterium]MBM4300101.1 FkbM family methyltransferase [Deltaproteobacteria bacterium]